MGLAPLIFILKERLFCLTNNEANHGEDVKAYYFYIDSTHSSEMPKAKGLFMVGRLNSRKTPIGVI